ncbi:MAG: hypothetical protein RLZ91_1248, partial [Bacteroidota bacterium]
MRIIKYILPFVLFAGAWISYHSVGIACWASILFSFLFIPFAELFLPANEENLSDEDEIAAKNNPMYDLVLYVAFALHLICLFYFLNQIASSEISTQD